jgi:hypothetical protein
MELQATNVGLLWERVAPSKSQFDRMVSRIVHFVA